MDTHENNNDFWRFKMIVDTLIYILGILILIIFILFCIGVIIGMLYFGISIIVDWVKKIMRRK